MKRLNLAVIIIIVFMLCSSVFPESIRITTHSAMDYHPIWSNDGTKIAFTSQRTGDITLWVYDFADSSVQNVQDIVQGDQHIAGWLENDSMIIFDGYPSEADRNYNIYGVSLETGLITTLIDGPQKDLYPTLSYDKQSLVYLSDRSGKGAVWTSKLNGDSAMMVCSSLDEISYTRWSPDGSKIVFAAHIGDWTVPDDIYTVPSSGGNLVNITNHSAMDGHPIYTPDGSNIIFVSDRNGNLDLFVVPDTGGTPIEITNHPLNEWHPHLSPDGSKIAFTADWSGNLDVWVMDIDLNEDEITCGDIDGSGVVNLLDITFLINYLYKGGTPPTEISLADVNNSGTINILDVTCLINFLYKNGPTPNCG